MPPPPKPTKSRLRVRHFRAFSFLAPFPREDARDRGLGVSQTKKSNQFAHARPPGCFQSQVSTLRTLKCHCQRPRPRARPELCEVLHGRESSESPCRRRRPAARMNSQMNCEDIIKELAVLKRIGHLLIRQNRNILHFKLQYILPNQNILPNLD